MKKLRKLFLTVMVLCLCLSPLSLTASAADLVDPDNIDSIAQYFGIDMSDPESIQNGIDNIQNGGLSGIMSLLGIDVSAILNELSKQMVELEKGTTNPVTTETSNPVVIETTSAATTETTTEETTQAVATTVVERPVYIPVTQKPTEAATTEAATEAETTEAPAEAETTEAPAEETQATTKQNIESIGTEIPKTTIFIIISTIAVFVAGIATGIGITKYMSGKGSKKEE